MAASQLQGGELLSAISQQVEQMILQARKDSETRVRHDLSIAKSQLQHMEGLMGELRERMVRCAGPQATDPVQTVDRAYLSQKISELEQKWGSEVKALKQDLHRTILAHNHNSKCWRTHAQVLASMRAMDLMRHHRDALDEARRRLDAQTQPRAEQVDAQIEKVDRLLRVEKSKQRAVDALTERLAALEQQVVELLPNASLPVGHSLAAARGRGEAPGDARLQAAFTHMLPGMAGINPMLTPAMAAREQAAGKRASKKDIEAEAGDGIQFNAEAPVFVPRGADTAASAEAKQDEGSDDEGDSPSQDGSAEGEDR